MAPNVSNRDSFPDPLGGIRQMNSFFIFLSRLRGLFQKRKLENDLADEIQSHLEMQVEEHLRQGMTQEEARSPSLSLVSDSLASWRIQSANAQKRLAFAWHSVRK